MKAKVFMLVMAILIGGFSLSVEARGIKVKTPKGTNKNLASKKITGNLSTVGKLKGIEIGVKNIHREASAASAAVREIEKSIKESDKKRKEFIKKARVAKPIVMPLKNYSFLPILVTEAVTASTSDDGAESEVKNDSIKLEAFETTLETECKLPENVEINRSRLN